MPISVLSSGATVMRLPVVVPAPELLLEWYEMKVIALPFVSEKV